MGFPIRTSPDQSSFAAPRGLSQLIASFIVFQRQGIHRTPLVACLLELKMILKPLCIGAAGASLLPTPKYTRGAIFVVPKKLPFAGYSVVKDQNRRQCHQSKLCLRISLAGPPAVAASEASAQRRLVENTGIEPVTSWLQTRRSPS